MATFILKFDTPIYVSPAYLDGVKIRFGFAYIDSEYIKTSRQNSETKRGKINIQASRSLLDTWLLEGDSIERVLFQIVRGQISFVLVNDGILPNEIQLSINTRTHPGCCPYDFELTERPAGAIFQVEVKQRMGFL